MPTENSRVLDVGAEVDILATGELQFIDLYPWKHRISAINISQEHISHIKKCYHKVDAVVGDACKLPWPDNYFDVVYSNAVIEHLGSFEKQQKMASEIMRVGNQWFLTTPNRWYPFEFHMRLPFVTWLPGKGYLWAGRIVAYNHVKKKYTFGSKRRDLRLMTARELKHCFPSSKIIKLRVTFMAETLIVVGDKCRRNSQSEQQKPLSRFLAENLLLIWLIRNLFCILLLRLEFVNQIANLGR
jgi:ubiquinone/menaquinone biosynthesis C-methylase UbiE